VTFSFLLTTVSISSSVSLFLSATDEPYEILSCFDDVDLTAVAIDLRFELLVSTYCLSGDVMTDSFHVRSKLLRRPLDLSVALVAQASDIPVSLVVDCEEGSAVLYIFLTRHIDDGSIRVFIAAGDGLFLFIVVFVSVG